MVAVTSDGETASITVSTAVLARQVQEALVQGQFDDAMRQLREAGIGKIGISDNWEFLSVSIEPDGSCGEDK